MNKRLKFHATAIAIICGVITLLYVIVGPREASEPAVPESPYKISILSASWGYNCNPYIKEAIKARKLATLAKDADGKLIQPPSLKIVERDNVLKQVGDACNGKPNCELMANIELFGFDPHEGCFKQLEVSYRCYDIDRLRLITTEQAAKMNIDCTSIETPANAEKTAQ